VNRPSLDELVREPALALKLSSNAALDLLLQLAPVERNLIIAAARRSLTDVGMSSDIEVDAHEGARRIGVASATFYKHLHEYPFVRRSGRKILCSLAGIERWKRQGRGVE
jgi:hypothetical protein